MKKFSKPLGLLSTTLCALLVALTCYADPVPVAPVGDGTDAANAYEIATVENLYWVTQNDATWNRYFKVTAELDLSDSWEWDFGGGFSPIGSTATAFTGTFDGGDFAITGLAVNRKEEPTGMFGVASAAATLANLNLVDVDISGGDSVGGLVGSNAGLVSGCTVTGTVNGTTYVGGIAGDSGGTIELSSMDGTVRGTTDVGGILGYSTSEAFIDQTHSNASVLARNMRAGGVLGGSLDPVILSNSYATGSVAAPTHVGGLIGHSGPATVSNSYSTATIAGNTDVGGLVGLADGGTVSGSFWDTETSGQPVSNGGTGKTSAEMMTLATFTDALWDFTVKWSMDDGVASPVLQWQIVVVPDPEPEPEPEPTPDLVDDITAFESDSSDGGCFIGILN